jgi:hypothetical protein
MVFGRTAIAMIGFGNTIGLFLKIFGSGTILARKRFLILLLLYVTLLLRSVKTLRPCLRPIETLLLSYKRDRLS